MLLVDINSDASTVTRSYLGNDHSHHTLGLCGNRNSLWLLPEAELVGVQQHVAEMQSLRNAKRRCVPLHAESTDSQGSTSRPVASSLLFCLTAVLAGALRSTPAPALWKSNFSDLYVLSTCQSMKFLSGC